MEVIPKKEWNKDDLAGGMYCPIGLGSIPPGPKLQVRKFWKAPRASSSSGPSSRRSTRHKIPFLRKTMACPPVQVLAKDIACLLGMVGRVWNRFCPKDYAANQALNENADDCMFPPRGHQESTCPIFANQFIARTIGGGGTTDKNNTTTTSSMFHGMDRSDLEISLHCDETDYNTKMPSVFLPMGKTGGPGDMSLGVTC